MIVEDYMLFLSGESGVLDYKCEYGRILIAGDKSPQTYSVTLQIKQGDVGKSGTYTLHIDGGEAQSVTSDGEGYITITLDKGAHYLSLDECDNYVYVNNYSGTGTQFIKSGYYDFFFHLS